MEKNKKGIDMGLFGKKYITKETLKHISGIPNLMNEYPVIVTVNEKEKTVEFVENRRKKKLAAKAILSIDKITHVEIFHSDRQQDIIRQRSHSARNTLVGAVVAGPVGAIIGSNTGNEKTATIDLLGILIEYQSDGETHEIVLLEIAGIPTYLQHLKAVIERNLPGFVPVKSLEL